MKKIAIILVIFSVALILGFLIGQNTAPIEKIKFIKEKVVDTVYKSKVVKVEIEKPVKSVDTVFILTENTQNDSSELDLKDSIEVIDEILDEDSLQIKRDKRIKSETLLLTIIKEESKDTLLEKLLDIETVKQKKINVEYWESPLNYSGYKLSKSKLIVYGIIPLSKSKIYKNDSEYYFETNNLYYRLEETPDFKEMMTIAKPNIFND